MKTNRFKFMMALSWMLFATLLVVSSCKKDDETPPATIIEDGLYVKGAGTALTGYDAKGLMKEARNEVENDVTPIVTRPGLMELYVAVKAGTEGFNIVEVTGGVPKVYGPGADFAVIDSAARDIEEPKVDFWRGTYTASSTPFTVPVDGLYHVMLDKELGKIAIVPVKWGVIGGATPGLWGASTPMSATFNLTKMEFIVEDLVLLENQWKFRYSDGWKVILDKDLAIGGGKTGVKVNTNFGGAVNALVAGGGNFDNAVYGKYKVTLTWELGKSYVATAVKTGDGPPIDEYPATMFMIGDALNLLDGDVNGTPDGWQWELTDAPMVPVNLHPEYFWKIVWLSGSGGFKFCDTKAWGSDFGGADGSEGIGTFDKGTANIVAPTTPGYYMVVLDLKTKKIEVSEPSVFMVGDCVGGYTDDPANKFIVDNANEKLTFTKDMAAGDVRLHATSTLMVCDWWQAEFIVLNGKIEFRGTGNDQTRVPLTAGSHTIDLNFRTGDGSIN